MVHMVALQQAAAVCHHVGLWLAIGSLHLVKLLPVVGQVDKFAHHLELLPGVTPVWWQSAIPLVAQCCDLYVVAQ